MQEKESIVAMLEQMEKSVAPDQCLISLRETHGFPSNKPPYCFNSDNCWQNIFFSFK